MDIGDLRGALTAVLFVLFVALSIWNFSSRRRAEYDAAAQLPLQDDDAPPTRED